jgi:hypothetical protein
MEKVGKTGLAALERTLFTRAGTRVNTNKISKEPEPRRR